MLDPMGAPPSRKRSFATGLAAGFFVVPTAVDVASTPIFGDLPLTAGDLEPFVALVGLSIAAWTTLLVGFARRRLAVKPTIFGALAGVILGGIALVAWFAWALSAAQHLW